MVATRQHCESPKTDTPAVDADQAMRAAFAHADPATLPRRAVPRDDLRARMPFAVAIVNLLLTRATKIVEVPSDEGPGAW